jgi:ABC-type Fe3+ transport system permease subunit
MRLVARLLVNVLLALPVIALGLAVITDRSANGAWRFSRFGLALLASDPFVWTCATNSLAFAGVVSGLALLVGALIGWGVGRSGSRFWRVVVGSLLAISPAFAACGVLGLAGLVKPWAWLVTTGGMAGTSLESWAGFSSWVVWIWSTLPPMVAIVALGTARAVGRLSESRDDAARIMGGGRFWTWYHLSWPMVRPEVAKSVGLVFLISLMEPGVPCVLGLRRTLAFQVVDALTQAGGLGRAAALSLLAGLAGLAGWWLIQWWGRGWRLADDAGENPADASTSRRTRIGGGAVAAGVLITLTLLAGWVPVLGLGRLVCSQGLGSRWPVGMGLRGLWLAGLDRLVDPAVWRVVSRSLVLGLTAMPVVAIAGSIIGRGGEPGRIRGRAMSALFTLPPLVQVVGVLCLAGIAEPLLDDLAGLRMMKGVRPTLQSIGHWLNLEQNPWPWLVLTSALLAGQPFWVQARAGVPITAGDGRSGWDAALLLNSSRRRARWLCRRRRFPRNLAGHAAAGLLAVTNVVAPLAFLAWPGCATISAGVIELVESGIAASPQAATLAGIGILFNLISLGLLRLRGNDEVENDG